MLTTPDLFNELQAKEQQLEAIREILVLNKNAEAPLMEDSGYLRAMSLKIDPDRYKRLKLMGLDTNKTSQQLLIEAVDMLLAQKP